MVIVPATLSGEVVIADGVERIPDACFCNNQNITDIIIPNTVRSIGREAFGYCSFESIELEQ